MVRLADVVKQAKKYERLCKRRVLNSSAPMVADRGYACAKLQKKKRANEDLKHGNEFRGILKVFHPIFNINLRDCRISSPSCLNDVDPLTYLTDVLTRIVNGHTNSDIDQLLPWAYRQPDLKAVA